MIHTTTEDRTIHNTSHSPNLITILPVLKTGLLHENNKNYLYSVLKIDTLPSLPFVPSKNESLDISGLDS